MIDFGGRTLVMLLLPDASVGPVFTATVAEQRANELALTFSSPVTIVDARDETTLIATVYPDPDPDEVRAAREDQTPYDDTPSPERQLSMLINVPPMTLALCKPLAQSLADSIGFNITIAAFETPTLNLVVKAKRRRSRK